LLNSEVLFLLEKTAFLKRVFLTGHAMKMGFSLDILNVDPALHLLACVSSVAELKPTME
jgi:hypothetical protein